MKIKNNIVPVFLMVLTLIGCTQEDLIGPTNDVPQGMKTVTVDFQLPDDKPAFHEEGQSRAATGGWETGDELMMKVTVKGFDDTKGYAVYESYVTLAYDGAAWDVVEDKSITTLYVNSTYTNPDYVMLAQTTDIDLTKPLTINVPEDMTLDYALVFLAYGPDMEWNLTPDANGAVTDVRYKAKATATTTAPECWEYSSGAWTINQARLRVYTGKADDVVTLTSDKFYPNSIGKADDGIYTATTDVNGDAYFYGKAGTYDDSDRIIPITSNFKLELTAIGGNVLTTRVTLLEASDLVPVELEAGEAYWLDASAKRNNVSQQ